MAGAFNYTSVVHRSRPYKECIGSNQRPSVRMIVAHRRLSGPDVEILPGGGFLVKKLAKYKWFAPWRWQHRRLSRPDEEILCGW
jgi:hypothetical protein